MATSLFDIEDEAHCDEEIHAAVKAKKLPKKNIEFASDNYQTTILTKTGVMCLDDADPKTVRAGDHELVGIALERPSGLLALINADQDDGLQNIYDDYFGSNGIISISYLCLQRFYPDKENVVDKIATKKLQLVAYTQDKSIDLSAKDQKAWRAWANGNKQKPCPIDIPAGFTVIHGGSTMHCSATALFYDVKGDFTIIMGQDEDTYFACELPKNCKTIPAAYKALMPAEAIKCMGKFKRQGEWFACPTNEPPAIEMGVITANELILERESEISNEHVLTGAIRIKDGIVYARGWDLEHNDHATMSSLGSNDWWSFHCNLAVRSFSQEGVD